MMTRSSHSVHHLLLLRLHFGLGTSCDSPGVAVTIFSSPPTVSALMRGTKNKPFSNHQLRSILQLQLEGPAAHDGKHDRTRRVFHL
jgi:hypothetical protein